MAHEEEKGAPYPRFYDSSGTALMAKIAPDRIVELRQASNGYLLEFSRKDPNNGLAWVSTVMIMSVEALDAFMAIGAEMRRRERKEQEKEEKTDEPAAGTDADYGEVQGPGDDGG